VALALVTAGTILLPRGTWEILLPVAWSLPIVLWLAARSRPAFAAAGAFLVSISIVWTTIYGIGHFGDSSFSVADRVLGAQTAILFVAISLQPSLPNGGRSKRASYSRTLCWNVNEIISY
jgi:hypothetical protein